MYSADEVTAMIQKWKQDGVTKPELIVKIAEACMGWPYVWGALGEMDTVSQREYYMNRSAIGEGDRNLIKKRCQVLNGSRGECAGCTYYPHGARTRIFDCRGFTRWVLSQVGLSLKGAGATSQWNDNTNWSKKGPISEMPPGAVCCVFKHIASTGKMDHTGLHVGSGKIIHCSVEVKTGKTSDSGWTHYAIPRGLDDSPMPVWRSTVRRGSSGEDVVFVQETLLRMGYDLGVYGTDGKFGAKTEAAVKAFQRANGLSADGIVGPLTYEALEKADPLITDTYTVTIHGLSEAQANELMNKYPGAEKKEE